MTDSHTVRANAGHPSMAARASSASATTTEASTLDIAVSQAVSPSRGLAPAPDSHLSGSGRTQAAMMA